MRGTVSVVTGAVAALLAALIVPAVVIKAFVFFLTLGVIFLGLDSLLRLANWWFYERHRGD